MERLSPLFKLIHDYLLISLPKEQKCSPHTCRSYRKALVLFFDFVKEKENVPLRKVTFDMINRNMLSEFLIYLEEDRGCSAATRNQRLHAIRAFYRYAAEEDITAVTHFDEIKKVRKARVPEKLVEHMNAEAVRTVLEQPNTMTDKGRRDAFMLLFLYKTGARVQELLNVKLNDIQLGETPRVLLHGKGDKIRAVPLREDVVLHLKPYLALFHPEETLFSEQHLFYTVRSYAKKRMTESNVRNLVSNYGKQARKICPEVPEFVHPHLFRHSWAMTLYQNGVDLTLVSQWLGHAQLETTLIYAHADTELKRRAMEKAVPEDSPLKGLLNAERYKISDDDLLKQLCGLK